MSRKGKQFIGLDLETSGTEIDQGAVPIQLGIALGSTPSDAPEIFSEVIGGWNFYGFPHTMTDKTGRSATWSGRAAGVHNISMKTVRKGSPARVVAQRACDFLDGHGLPDAPDLHIVGWNVAGFDLPFVRRYLPQLDRRISYRTVDLNAITFSLVGGRINANTRTMSYRYIKGRAKDYAAQRIEFEGVFPRELWHDAGYDALAAVYSFEELQRLVRQAT